MKEPKIEKTVLNIGTGQSGSPVMNAKKILRDLTSRDPIETKAKGTNPEWGIRKGLSIGALVTLRGEKSKEILRKLFEAKNQQLKSESFDERGNVSFGIEEHIEIPGMEYDPDIGIHGLDITISMGRPGYRIQRRRIRQKEVSKEHILTKDESIDFFKREFDVEIVR